MKQCYFGIFAFGKFQICGLGITYLWSGNYILLVSGLVNGYFTKSVQLVKNWCQSDNTKQNWYNLIFSQNSLDWFLYQKIWHRKFPIYEVWGFISAHLILAIKFRYDNFQFWFCNVKTNTVILEIEIAYGSNIAHAWLSA